MVKFKDYSISAVDNSCTLYSKLFTCGGGSSALARKPLTLPRLSSLMVSTTSWRGVRWISGVMCTGSLGAGERERESK